MLSMYLHVLGTCVILTRCRTNEQTLLVQVLLVRLFTIDFLIHTAEKVLKEYRDRFIAEMDASTVVSDFVYHDIIPDGVRESIAKADGPRQRNSTLHDCLLKTCTNEALKTACGIIASVEGNPRMSALGKDMQRRLEAGVCTCVCMHVCVCVCVCACVCVRVCL